METLINLSLKFGLVLVALGSAAAGSGCASPHLPKGMVGRLGKYDYSPSVIQSGNIRQFWWCGEAVNPAKSTQDADAILYESVNMTTGATEGPMTVMAETPGAWDTVYTCNPKVVGGTFNNPLGDGRNFNYAMYYVGTADPSGANNNIGVAFSNDGIGWNKYPQPVILRTSSNGYGVGQPAVYNSDQKAAIALFYEDSNPTTHHMGALSTDGVHFTLQGTLTTAGLDPDCEEASWGDMAYDSLTGFWYAVYNLQDRDPSTTGGVEERGQLGVELYRIQAGALLTGSSPWQQLETVDTNMTGFESNFIASFVRDTYGTVNVGSYPVIQMYASVSDYPPAWDASPSDAANSAVPNQWDLAPVQWAPNRPSMPLYRYFNGKVHEVTTGWINPHGGFQQELMLGQLYESPQRGAALALYACKNGNSDYFVSLDSGCEGKRILGKNGYGYSQPVAGLNLVAIYRCSTGHDHFVSQDPKCEGEMTDELLGYAVP